MKAEYNKASERRNAEIQEKLDALKKMQPMPDEKPKRIIEYMTINGQMIRVK